MENIYYLCRMKNLLQRLADSVIRGMEKTASEDVFDFYYEFGMWLDNVAIQYFGIYLE